ncbi:hydroxyacid dehydrogenase [bacterium]|uniref:Hydroxyacid dehydrogenase n=1 Tax=candidate division WWE3 bacterium CG22_combo_CG10-13_8_21_14_all_39_12 TaxID=1975094 RepID=A0A2H0BFD8_UNCKA|nr:hydroxyacid dehydrogenase [bacterium]PIP56375.1 MAG: hydroxyacid dehydrogenase [candidate division WWE3 bacterium CG22_combo_CG10-13_8_21_14_all_39_12]
MKILFTHIEEEWQKKFFEEKLPNHELTFLEGPLTVDNVMDHRDTQVLSVFVGSPIDTPIINSLADLSLIATRSTGFDHIDLSKASQKKITVCNVPFYGENTVAEHAFTLMLSLSRMIPESLDRTEDGSFDYHGLRGWDVKGKTIGIVGGGHIGMHMARMARGFHMNVIVFDINRDEKMAAELGFTYVDLDEMYAKADVISLHVPLNDHTKHMLNKDAFAKMKDGVVIINTARGGLIDTDSLIVALRSGKVSQAGLDVLEGEEDLIDEVELTMNNLKKDEVLTLLQNHQLMEMPHVIITPHNAFNSIEAVQRILQTTVDNIEAFEKNVPINVVS